MPGVAGALIVVHTMNPAAMALAVRDAENMRRFRGRTTRVQQEGRA